MRAGGSRKVQANWARFLTTVAGRSVSFVQLKAVVDGVRLMRRSRRRGALASSVSIAANSFSMARAVGLCQASR